MATIRIERSKMIEVLKAAVATREATVQSSKDADKKYEKDVEKYNAALLKAVKSGKLEVVQVNPFNPYYRNSVDRQFDVRFIIPNSIDIPQRDQVDGNVYQLETEIEQISQTIRLLELSDDAYVPATLYKSITKFL